MLGSIGMEAFFKKVTLSIFLGGCIASNLVGWDYTQSRFYGGCKSSEENNAEYYKRQVSEERIKSCVEDREEDESRHGY